MLLLNIPVVGTEKTPGLSSKGDVILADLSQYAIGLRADVILEASRHAGWSQDSTFYRAVIEGRGRACLAACSAPPLFVFPRNCGKAGRPEHRPVQ